MHYSFKFNSLTLKAIHVNRFYIFVIRAILGALLAMVMMRFFYPGANLVYTGALGIFLVFMAYMTESFRKKKK